MTTLRERILSTITDALKQGRKEEANTLRFLMAQVKNREIELRSSKASMLRRQSREEGLNDEEMLEVILREVKKHRDSIAEFEKGGRDDLVQKERAELNILEQYAPAQMSEEEMWKEVGFAMQEVHAEGEKDFGKVMSVLMPRIKGKAEGATVSTILRDLLKSG